MKIKKYPAKVIVNYYEAYRKYLEENGLTADLNNITVAALIEFVEDFTTSDKQLFGVMVDINRAELTEKLNAIIDLLPARKRIFKNRETVAFYLSYYAATPSRCADRIADELGLEHADIYGIIANDTKAEPDGSLDNIRNLIARSSHPQFYGPTQDESESIKAFFKSINYSVTEQVDLYRKVKLLFPKQYDEACAEANKEPY